MALGGWATRSYANSITATSCVDTRGTTNSTPPFGAVNRHLVEQEGVVKRRIRVAIVTACLGLSTSVGAQEEHLVYDAWFGEVGGGIVAAGVSETVVERVMKRITEIDPFATGPGSWVYEFGVPADVHLRRAQNAETAGDREQAVIEYRAANAFFNAARWPALFTSERRAAYEKQLETYLRLADFEGLPLEVVRIPYEGREIVGHLHKPAGGRAPVILWSGGLDGWKDTAIDFKKSLLEHGFAVFAMDLPGTGESQWKLEATSERIYSRAIDHLKTRSDVDASRIAPYFGSFSGAYAIKLTLRDPDVACGVNHSGGIHLFYHPPMTEIPALTTSVGMRATATIHALGMTGEPNRDVISTYSTFSLKNQGYLQPTPQQAPLLTIHGTADVLMPVEDVHLMSESGVEQTTLIYEGSPHMAWDHAHDHRPKMIAFLKECFGM